MYTYFLTLMLIFLSLSLLLRKMKFQKTRHSERITPSQSFKTVMRVLQMSISCIAFLRGFFDDDHFQDSTFVTDESNKENGLRIKLLKPGKSQEAEILLDWIENAIRESLEEKCLKAINLSIVLDPNNPAEIFESYCFEIGYDNEGPSVLFDNDVHVKALSLNNTVNQTRTQIYQLLKRFIVITQALPNLPEERYLSMQLLFNKDIKEGYCPAKFVDCSEEKPAVLKVPADYALQFDVTECGSMNSNYHQVTTRIMSLSTIDLPKVSSDTKFKEIDPFRSLLDDEVLDADDGDITLVENQAMVDKDEMSQITKELNDFVYVNESAIMETQKFVNSQQEDPSTEAPDEQTVSQIVNHKKTTSCECMAKRLLDFSSNIECIQCHELFHKTCYAIDNDDNSSASTFKCLRCKGVQINDNIISVFAIRKIVKWLISMSTPNLISLNNVYEKLGYHFTNAAGNRQKKRKTQIILKNSLSVLFYEEILSLKTRKTFFHQPFEIETLGVVLNQKPINPGTYYINFIRNSENVNKYIECDILKLSKEVENSMRAINYQNEEADSPIAENLPKGMISETQDIFDFMDMSQTTNTELPPVKKRKVSKSIDIVSV